MSRTKALLILFSLGMSFINPYENMKKLGINAQNSKEKLTLVYNRHYSAEGNALYARALAPLLVDLLGQRQQVAHE